jgi:hypothetical protein
MSVVVIPLAYMEINAVQLRDLIFTTEAFGGDGQLTCHNGGQLIWHNGWRYKYKVITNFSIFFLHFQLYNFSLFQI